MMLSKRVNMFQPIQEDWLRQLIFFPFAGVKLKDGDRSIIETCRCVSHCKAPVCPALAISVGDCSICPGHLCKICFEREINTVGGPTSSAGKLSEKHPLFSPLT